jgi:hypothetical protein
MANASIHKNEHRDDALALMCVGLNEPIISIVPLSIRHLLFCRNKLNEVQVQCCLNTSMVHASENMASLLVFLSL